VVRSNWEQCGIDWEWNNLEVIGSNLELIGNNLSNSEVIESDLDWILVNYQMT